MTAAELRDLVTGPVVLPDDPAWDTARLFHSGIGEPDAIIQPQDLTDVQEAVRWAAAARIPIVVRSGGHSEWGTVPGGLVVDLRGFAEVRVVDRDADGGRVSVGGGAHWGDVARALSAEGLAVSSGDTASVGVGGLTLGGGIGWMVRAWGLAADQLVGAQLVTASGDVVEATDASHSDLMWALRGGGGNFGVVTRFDFRAHALRAVAFADLAVSGDARDVLRALRDLITDAPRELTVTYMDVPPGDPSAAAGATLTACWANDDLDAARATLAPILALDGITETAFAVRAYPEILLDAPDADPDAPLPGFVGGNALVADLDEDVIDRLAAFREANEASVLFLRSIGGAYGDVAQVDSAFPARDAQWFVMAGVFDIPGSFSDDDRMRAEQAWEAIAARGAGFYGNFSPSIDAALVERMYAPATMTRLVAVKREWDPDNVFSRNHNVRPA